MSGTNLGILVAIIGLIVLAGFFALAETSLTRMNRIKAQTLEEQGRRGPPLRPFPLTEVRTTPPPGSWGSTGR